VDGLRVGVDVEPLPPGHTQQGNSDLSGVSVPAGQVQPAVQPRAKAHQGTVAEPLPREADQRAGLP
jgi:hypothetical protein